MKTKLKNKIAVLLFMAAALFTALAEMTAQEQMDDLKRQIDRLLETAPTGPHGGKIVSPEMKMLMDRRSGGLIVPKTNGRTFLLIDARGVKDEILLKFADNLKRRLHLGVTSITNAPPTEGADLFNFAQGFKTQDHPAIVCVVDSERGPSISAYPEDAIAVVNVAKLKTADTALFTKRVSKETWRGVALAMGGYIATAPNGRIVKSLLSPVYSVDDLDALDSTALSPAQCRAVCEAVKPLGLEAARPTTYAVACRQGWAPAPTNEIQRAIWERVHAIPSRPMKIEFDPKKGR